MINNLTDVFGTQAQMMMQYIRDVSAMLCFVSAVRENTIERHLAAERVLLPKCFAFGHQNYARYPTFQHVKLQDIRSKQEGAWNDLLVNGFGGSVSGKPYSTIHGDLITETTINREVKVRGGPMQGGFSTDEKAVDTFVKTSHFMATFRAKLKERLDVLTQSVHKETTIGAIKKHEAMIEGLVLQLDKYFDPFLDGPARHFKTGAEIEPSVIEGLLNSSAVGEAMYAEFIDERLKAKENRVSIFASIKNPRIKTGMERAKKIPKAISILKEDRQAFGSLVGKATSPRDAHSYPLTTVPLALASPDSDLRQCCKAALRNFLIEESLAEVQTPLSKAAWLVDGMAAVRSIKSKPTWGEYAKAYFRFCTPAASYQAHSIAVIFDNYTQETTKQLTQRRRGHGFLSCAKEFFRTVMYGGNKGECHVDTRIRMYERQKVKSSLGIIPDENSTTQHLKRSCLQAYIWHQCTQQMINYPPLTEAWGWKEEETGIVPIWYTCSQFPPNNNQSDTESSGDGAEVVSGSKNSEAESTDNSEYDFDADSDGGEDEF